MSTVLVFGRRRPNNDSIMSSLVAAQMLNKVNQDATYVPVRLGELPAETLKLFQAWNLPTLDLLDHIPAPLPGEPAQRVYLCDHNEPSQSVKGIEHAEVVGVIDHHRVAAFRSFSPLTFIALPWGATATIVRHLFQAYGVRPTNVQAGCLLSAIMTDTLMLKSPATTLADTSYAESLARQLGVDLGHFGREVFRYRESESYSPNQMVMGDVKRFEVGGKSLAIAKYETMDRAAALDRLPELRAEMDAERDRWGISTFVQLVVDVPQGGSQILVSGDVRPVEEALGVSVPEGGVWMDGVISRKVQVQPKILAALERRS